MDQLPFISQQSQKHHTSLLQNLSSAFSPNQSFIHHVDPCEDSSRTALGLEVRHLPSPILHLAQLHVIAPVLHGLMNLPFPSPRNLRSELSYCRTLLRLVLAEWPS